MKKKMKAKEIAERMFKTFVQAFVASFSITSVTNVTDVDTLKRTLLAVTISAAAAGISAVWNVIQSYVAEWKEGE